MIHLGYEVGSGQPVSIPVRHLAVTGQTQESGKTTTLEALISRSGLRAVAFVTKRAEGSFTTGHQLSPYFRERADWQFVSAVLEATLRERLKFERSWIMRACKGAHSLVHVQRNIRTALPKAKGLSADVYLTLDEYLSLVIPQIERLPYTDTLTLAPGLSVMDLAGYTMELQALVIRSVVEAIYARERETVVLVPEAWEFIPQARSSPAVLAILERRPELRVEVQRQVVTVEGDAGPGWIGRLIVDGFFDQTTTGYSTFIELQRRGARLAKPTAYTWSAGAFSRRKARRATARSPA